MKDNSGVTLLVLSVCKQGVKFTPSVQSCLLFNASMQHIKLYCLIKTHNFTDDCWWENALRIYLCSEKASLTLDTKVDLADVKPSLKGPQSILEQNQGGVQDKGVRAASLLATTSNQQSAQDN